jgi:hypothetical protein
MKCGYIKNDGNQCKNIAKDEYDGQRLCGIHMNVKKKEEECAICYYKLKSKTKVLKLECGHMFHVTCLSKCIKRECPLCRDRISPNDCYNIYEDDIIKPIIKRIFKFTEGTQQCILNNINSLIDLYDKSETMI